MDRWLVKFNIWDRRFHFYAGVRKSWRWYWRNDRLAHGKSWLIGLGYLSLALYKYKTR